MAKREETVEFSVVTVERQKSTFFLLGTTPLIFHRMAQKAQRELLMPKGRKTAYDKAASLKHDPYEEFRGSVYRAKPDLKSPTTLVFPGEAFHQAMSDAALDLPGLKKAQIGRLCGVADFDVSIFGIPEIYLAVVRNSDMNRTPDIRSRAILPLWACQVTVWSTRPLIKQADVVKLMGAAGVFVGIGDNRQQKGGGSFGLWDVVNDDDKRFQTIVKNCGAAAQDAALEDPAPHNQDTEELLTWFSDEVRRRQDQPIKKRPSKEDVTYAQ